MPRPPKPPKSPFVPVPLLCGGMSSAGDLADLPDGAVALLENRLIRPGRFPKRPPTTYDALDNIVGLANFDDATNKVNRLLAIDSARKLYEKAIASGGETWSASLGTISSGVRLTDATYYRGVLYGMLADSNGLPLQAFSFDGTNLSSTPFNSAIQSRTITALNERLFLGYPRVVVTPANTNQPATTSAYDWTSTRWTKTNVTVSNLPITGGVTVCRVFPTSLTASACQIEYTGLSNIGLVTVGASAGNVPYLWQQWLSNSDATTDCPYTLEIRISIPVALVVPTIPHTFALGDVVTSGGFIQRCATAGIANSGAPAWNATKGGTTAWDAATFTNEGSDVIAFVEGTITNATDAPNGVTVTVPITIPRSQGSYINPRLKLYNTTQPALTTLTPIDISLKDGLTDGDVRKVNHGLQITAGDFYYPFFNCESTVTATIDMKAWVWSEILQPKSIRASNTFQPQDFTGDPTASCTIEKRLIGFYRNGFIQWVGTSDPDIPIREEKTNTATGCLGSVAHDEFNNEVFFIAEDDCYRYRVGQDAPTPFCGDGMREEIMARGSTWVESQSTYKRPLLHIDKSRLLVYVYTQRSLLYVFDLRTSAWSRFTLPNSTELNCMLWNQNTGNMYLSLGGHGLVRLDYSVVAEDSIDSGVTTYPITANVIYRPIELQSPQRFDSTIESIEVYDSATASQSGQTVTASYSYNQGKTFGNSITCEMVPGSGEFKPVFLSGWESAPTITVKHSHTGKGGESVSCLSPRGVALLLIRRGEYAGSRPLSVSSSL